MIILISILVGFIGNIAYQNALPDDSEREGRILYRKAMELESQTPPDTTAAIQLYIQSAESGFVPAMRYLGFLFYGGKGTRRDASQGIIWLKKAADKGDAVSWENLGWIYRHGSENEKSERLAVEAFTQAAQAGRPQGAYELAQMKERGEGTACDTLSAIQYYEQALLGNHMDADAALANLTDWRMVNIAPDSALRLSKRYFYGKAPIAATAILSKLIHSKSCRDQAIKAEAKTILAQATSIGRGTSYNQNLSTDLYYQAAIEGDPSAQFIIAELLESFPDTLDDLIDRHITNHTEKENHKDSSYWRELAFRSGITTAEKAEKRLQHF